MEKRMIAVPSRTKEILDRYGLRAKKGFGQNFLVDPIIVTRCAEMAHPEGAVIEIGPGIGSLTEALAQHAKHVTSYEIDEGLIPVLQDTLSDYDNVEIILQDFLECDIQGKVKQLKQEYGQVTVCANLPYYITTPVLFRIFSLGNDIPYITVMVQKEVGDRFAAKPNDPEYGALSVQGQYLYNIRKLFTVPGRSFNPSPKVDSVIIQFERKEDVDLSIDLDDFFDMIRAVFKQRRKTIYNNLREYLKDGQKARDVLQKAGIEEGARGQELSVEQIRNLYEVLQ
ncbi:MAG: 16S rRNA (adenine(1518)-N(6)/adenine(1519)-N(6))-dimethyltransferase RsmA [Bulleidia sp.]